ncbi:MAG TPA: ATP-binding protein [Myxococcota bacterium]|nr:ATP-binding protein [Myxococcota bacterium]HPV05129.1 ATP-binding protein [Myxococcota bacterium]
MKDIHESQALAERLKELHCVTGISTILADRNLSSDDVFAGVLEELCGAFMFPGAITARLQVRDRVWYSRESDSIPEPAIQMNMDLVVKGAGVGVLCLAYPADSDADYSFLPEEKVLVDSVVSRLVDFIEFKQVEQELVSYRDQLRSLAAELTMAEDRERRQISLCLHDRIGQLLAVVKLRLESLVEDAGEADVKSRIDSACQLLRLAIEETRSLTFEISPPILHDLGFYSAIEWLCDHFRGEFGLDVRLSSAFVSVDVAESIQMMVFRATWELLTNVTKHSGSRTAEVSVCVVENRLRISVTDHGIGFDPLLAGKMISREGGFGLFSIRERLLWAGGQMTIESVRGRGTTVTIDVPVSDASLSSGGR